MKHIEKKKLSKNQLSALILSAVCVLVLAISIPISVFLLTREPESAVTEPPVILEGEARQGNLTLAYPTVNSQKQITFIGVKNPKEEFGFLKQNGENHLTMYYVDSNGKTQLYFPDICYEDATVNYQDFYMIDPSQYLTPTFLQLLCTGIQFSYFSERIPLSNEAEVRAQQLKVYGFDEDKATVVNFEYIDEMGEKVSHKITIGGENAFESGYYFMVDDRVVDGTEYVYSSGSNKNYYSHAISDYERFIKPLLVSKGLDSDKGYGPFLTTNYWQWKNEIHGEGESVKSDSIVAIYADTVSLSDENGGYKFSGYESFDIDLSELKKNEKYARVIKGLVGKTVGKLPNELLLTVSAYGNKIDFGSSETLAYAYKISEVEAILTDNGEITEKGTAVGENNVIKVAYTLAVSGVGDGKIRHAVIDLRELADIEADKLRALTVGALAAGSEVSVSVQYTKSNANLLNEKYKITEIISVTDKTGKNLDKIASESIVVYRYIIETDGTQTYEGIGQFSLAKKEKNEVEQKLYDVLIGRGVSRNISLEFNSIDSHFEYFQTFTTYKISEIKYFLTKELVVAFRFVNSENRDPYYGESFYENIMDNEKNFYGLNAGACEQIVKILGGLSEENTTGTAAGLSGEEVVAIGLDPDVMKRYKLYANRIYFELPRIIYDYKSQGAVTDNKNLDDYGWYDTIGFTLYISDVDPVTQKRYIASDMYDIVTTVSAEMFDFLNYDFETLWARRNMIFMETYDIDDITVKFNMQDLKGEYLFDLTHSMVKYEPSPGAEPEEYEKTTVFVTANGECTDNKLLQVIAEKGYTGISLEELYKIVYPNDPGHRKVYPDSLGTSYFKDLLIALSLTTYVDVMPEEDRAEAKKAENLVMSMKLKVVQTKNSSPYHYVYDFYRADDRRVLVSIYQVDLTGKKMTDEISEFYLSTFAFKKLATNFRGILNAEKITPEVGYVDEK